MKGRDDPAYIIFISFIVPPQPSHFIIMLFIAIGPKFSWLR